MKPPTDMMILGSSYADAGRVVVNVSLSIHNRIKVHNSALTRVTELSVASTPTEQSTF
jgi:hypothetical protein